jgi:hypothetical protein
MLKQKIEIPGSQSFTTGLSLSSILSMKTKIYTLIN